VTAYATTSQAIKLFMGVWEQMGPVNIHLAQGAVGTLSRVPHNKPINEPKSTNHVER
jgi:hypothetical protein